jgi:diguanylate cyclase (GGDEF)-like protein
LDLAILGPDAQATIRTVHRAAPNLPLITLANSAEQEAAQESLREGALDFVLRDAADAKTLEKVLRAALEHNTVDGLADLLRDEATGLHNRDGFRALTAKHVQSAQKSGGQLVLISVKVKNLKEIEAEFGHSGSQGAIREAAKLLNRSFRRTDLVARIGEEEFAILAADAAEPSVSIIRQRLESRLAACNRAREPWGAIEMQFTATFWSAEKDRPFSEILDSIESKAVKQEIVLRPMKASEKRE